MITYSFNEIAKTYDEACNKIAEMISTLNDLKGRFDVISNQTMDNADPLCEAQESLERLGVLLATCTIYKTEYEKEYEKDIKNNNNSLQA